MTVTPRSPANPGVIGAVAVHTASAAFGQVPGPNAAGTPWAVHGAALVDEWLHGFSWEGNPLARFIRGIDVAFQHHPATPLWRSPTPDLSLPSGPALTGLPPLEDAPFNLWHPLWLELADVWHLTGTWLHPETHFTINQVALAEQQSYLYVGCRDRENPAAPRRYDPHRDPVFHDQGVIVFPLRTFRALDFHACGHGPEAVMLLCAGTAVAESAVHEALEMHQSSPGVPVLDPHAPGVTVMVTVHWAGTVLPTTGFAHAGETV